ncbi:MAG TPA: DNA repair protein RadA [Spirochaetota bacterium]|nr:DNA repair protein RadA [Spirochaetota bacterium]HOM10853.1 DNA repair protein RadA [Spirochaetota bacterium]HPP50724.1 DNA repair protein RadA [Spirochaetota bacterium]HXK65795.1 DNA repair protein RadA [Spirochaetota bacterium]
MPKKPKTIYICNECGATFQKWLGKCPECNTWNTIVEEMQDTPVFKNEIPFENSIHPLSQVLSESFQRIPTGIGEFDLVCGGGVVPGSIILLGGEPGIGKSTLALQVAQHCTTLYCSGEETLQQIHLRSRRLNIKPDSIHLTSVTDIDHIEALIRTNAPQLVIIDSIQTLYSKDITSPVGSVSQIRYTASRLADIAKQTQTSILLIGHITKDGSIAGPKILEHIVDTVLYFEGDFTRDYRILRAFKNRFGSINEIALFTMTATGLTEVKDKNTLFVQSHDASFPGSVISATIEGTRTILFEAQSLVTATSFSNPRRMADGFDVNRLNLLVAVIEKHAKISLSSFDIFINVAGGFTIDDTSCDLAIAAAIISSLQNIVIPHSIGIIGELSLSGQVRSASHSLRRLIEFVNSGITTILLPRNNVSEISNTGFTGTLIPLTTIAELTQILQRL